MHNAFTNQGELWQGQESLAGRGRTRPEPRPEAIARGVERVRLGAVEPDVLAGAILTTLAWDRSILTLALRIDWLPP